MLFRTPRYVRSPSSTALLARKIGSNVLLKDGSIVATPMELKHDHGGLGTHYLDLQISIGEQSSFQSTVYQKRDDMPVFHGYRRFPHMGIADPILRLWLKSYPCAVSYSKVC